MLHIARIPIIRQTRGHSGADPVLLIQGVQREQSGIGGEVAAIESTLDRLVRVKWQAERAVCL